jgi:hypothetical protein
VAPALTERRRAQLAEILALARESDRQAHIALTEGRAARAAVGAAKASPTPEPSVDPRPTAPEAEATVPDVTPSSTPVQDRAAGVVVTSQDGVSRLIER